MGFPDTGRSLTYSLLYVQLNWVSTSILSTWSFGWVEIMPKTQMFWCFAFPGIYGISWFCWVFQSLHVSWSRVPMFLQVLDFNPEGPELDPHHWCIHGSHSPPTRPLVFFQSYTKKTKLWDFFRKKNMTCWVHTSMIQHSRQTEWAMANVLKLRRFLSMS